MEDHIWGGGRNAKGVVPGVKPHCGGGRLARLQVRESSSKGPCFKIWGKKGWMGLAPSVIPVPPTSACTNSPLSP